MSTTTPTETAPAVEADRPPSWTTLVATVARERHDPHYAAKTASLRFAAMPATEVSAYAYTEAYLGALRPAQRTGARRAVGICAKNPGAAQSPKGTYLPVGGSLALLHKATNHTLPGLAINAMTMQVNSLPMLDLESAAQTFDLIIGRCAALHLQVNFFDLTRTLLDWGNGITLASADARARVVSDFYSYAH